LTKREEIEIIEIYQEILIRYSKMLIPWKKSYDKPRECIKKERHCFADKGPYSQSYDFSRSHV
jgi:hypothetical protein